MTICKPSTLHNGSGPGHLDVVRHNAGANIKTLALDFEQVFGASSLDAMVDMARINQESATLACDDFRHS
jgi:hypothetical protein